CLLAFGPVIVDLTKLAATSLLTDQTIGKGHSKSHWIERNWPKTNKNRLAVIHKPLAVQRLFPSKRWKVFQEHLRQIHPDVHREGERAIGQLFVRDFDWEARTVLDFPTFGRRSPARLSLNGKPFSER